MEYRAGFPGSSQVSDLAGYQAPASGGFMSESVIEELRYQLRDQLGVHLWGELVYQIWAHLQDQMELEHQLQCHLRDQLRYQI